MEDLQMSKTIIHAMWVIVPILPAWQRAAGVRAQSSSGASQSALIERAVVGRDRAAWDAVVALGATAASQVEVYLSHEDPRVRECALWLLCQTPEAAPNALVNAMRSTDEFLNRAGVAWAKPFMGNPGVQEAWINCFTQRLRESNPLDAGYNVLIHLDPDVRAAMAEDLVRKILRSLESYDARCSRIMVMIIGELSAPGDVGAIRRLMELSREAEGDLPPRWRSPWGAEDTQKDRNRLLVALEFALANLGDEESFQQYAVTVLGGQPEARVSRLSVLGRFRLTRSILQLVAGLLDDRAPLRNVTPSHVPSLVYKRSCDFAVDAVVTWFPGFPIKGHESFVYGDEELAQAREWLQARLAASGK